MTFDEWWYDIAALTGWKCSHEAAIEVWNASATAEREACAVIAETPVSGEQDDITMEAKDRVAAAIRARSNAELTGPRVGHRSDE